MSRDNLEDLLAEAGKAGQAYQSAVDALDEAVALHLGINRTDLRCLEILSEGRRLRPVCWERSSGSPAAV